MHRCNNLLVALLLLLFCFAHPTILSFYGGETVSISVSDNTSTLSLDVWAVHTNSLDGEVCADSGGALIVVRDPLTQQLFRTFIIMSGLVDDVWVGAMLTPDGKIVDTEETELSYTNFLFQPSMPGPKLCVVTSVSLAFKWKNIKFLSHQGIFALCTDGAVLPTQSILNLTVAPTSSAESEVTNAGHSNHTGIAEFTTREKETSPGKTKTSPRTTTTYSAIPDASMSSDVTTTLKTIDVTLTSQTHFDTSPSKTNADTSSTSHVDISIPNTDADTSTSKTNADTSSTSHVDISTSQTNVNVSKTTIAVQARLHSSSAILETTASSVGVSTGEPWQNPTNITSICSCACSWSRYNNTGNLADILDELRQNIMVDKATLSSTYRRKNSISDNRDTSVYMGCLAIVVLVVVLIIVVFLDMSHFFFNVFQCST